MGVRERTNEYGVLRALGFMPGHIVLFIVGESVLLGAVAAALGLGLGYPFVEYGMGRFIEENFGSWFPYFRVDLATVAIAAGLALALGAVAAVVPAILATRLTTVEALRRID
jgi:putative ABC transport system permease protein